MSGLRANGPSLRCVQEWMAARLLGQAPGELSGPGSAIDELLWVPARHRATDRLRVYQGGYPARVSDALVESYPAIARLLGDEAFSALAHRYASSVPLTSYNLNDAGAQMAVFLRGDELTRQRPFLPDLARLEWHVALAFHAAERPPFDPRTLAWSVDEWASAVLEFQSSVAVVCSPWPILDLWVAKETPDGRGTHGLDRSPDNVVVRRAGLIVRCESVSPHESLALRLLLEGHSLADTAGRLEAVDGDPDAVIAWFSRWASAGMIAAAIANDPR